MVEENKPNDEALEPTEAPAGVSAEQEHSNGNGIAVPNSDPQQQAEPTETGTPASESSPLEEFRAEDRIAGEGFEESPAPGVAPAEGSNEASAAQPTRNQEPREKTAGEKHQKQTRRFLNLSGPALNLWLKARDDLFHVGIEQEEMDDAARVMVQNSEISGVPTDSEKMETRDRVLAGDIIVIAFARRLGRHISLASITGTNPGEAVSSPAQITTNTVKGIEVTVDLPSDEEIATEEARDAESENWRRDSAAKIREMMAKIARVLKTPKLYEPNTAKIDGAVEATATAIAEANADQSAKEDVIRCAVQSMVAELLKPESRVTDFTLDLVMAIGVKFGYLEKSWMDDEKVRAEKQGKLPRHGILLHPEKDSVYYVPKFEQTPASGKAPETIRLLRELQAKVKEQRKTIR